MQRGRVPIVVGGTGFYLRWFTHGKAQGPKATPEAVQAVREALDKVWKERAAAAGVDELGAEDKWEAGVSLLAAWGDEEAAKRCGQWV